jgi:hypothetical protein
MPNFEVISGKLVEIIHRNGTINYIIAGFGKKHYDI